MYISVESERSLGAIKDYPILKPLKVSDIVGLTRLYKTE